MAAGRAVPLISVDAPCNTRQTVVRAFEEHGIAWTETFVTRGVAAVQAAASAGLGVACLGRRFRPPGTVTLGRESGLPALPPSEVALLDGTRDPSARAAVRGIADALRAVTAVEP